MLLAKILLQLLDSLKLHAKNIAFCLSKVNLAFVVDVDVCKMHAKYVCNRDHELAAKSHCKLTLNRIALHCSQWQWTWGGPSMDTHTHTDRHI